MTAGLDHLRPNGEFASPASRHRRDDRAHSGWLLELERALFANAATTSDSTHFRASPERHREHRVADSGTGTRPASGEDVSAPKPEPEADGSGIAAGTARAAQAGCEREAVRDGGCDAALQELGTAAGTQLSDTVQQQDRARHAPVSSVIFHAPAAAHALPLLSPAPNATDDTSSMARQPDQSRMCLPRGLFDRPQVGGGKPASSGDMTESNVGAPTQNAEASPESEAYSRRKLHLFHSKDGVHAWIRDADVGGPAAHAIAIALNAELSATGKRLAALTLNGKRVTQPLQVDGGNEEPAERAPPQAAQIHHAIRSISK